MHTVAVVITRTDERRELADKRSAFWSGLSRGSNEELSIDRAENRLRNDFVRHLTNEIQNGIWRGDLPYSGAQSKWPRFVFRIDNISYGSLKLELGIPNVDRF
jgi:hypothetical protein